MASQTLYNTKSTRAHTQRELIEGGASRASKGQEALWPPVLKARMNSCTSRIKVWSARNAFDSWIVTPCSLFLSRYGATALTQLDPLKENERKKA